MKTTIREERLIVVSDVHLGNRLHHPRRAFMDFVRFALDHRYSVVINGDGIDIAQLSLASLTADLTPSLGLLMRFKEKGQKIYYTVGNHDLALEHFLSDLGGIKVVPFLNVHSGDARIRVEHGHMYDEMFLKFPRFYTAFMVIGHLAISLSPRLYDGLHRLNASIIALVEWVFSGFRKRQGPRDAEATGIAGERECFEEGAEHVGMRGFDAVVFGHTHLPGSTELSGGAAYYNTGAWFSKPHCVAIDGGRIWFGPVAELLEGDPFPLPAHHENGRMPAHTQAWQVDPLPLDEGVFEHRHISFPPAAREAVPERLLHR